MVGKRADFQPALGGPLLPVEKLELGELQQVGEVIGVVGRRLVGHLLALGPDGGQAQGLQVVAQQHQGLGLGLLHEAAPCWVRVR